MYHPELWNIPQWEILLRLIIATVLGGLIGMEREWNNHAAGFRTHILVCLGSTTIMLLSIYGFGSFANESDVRLDPSRLAAQVVSGIGFLGAGAIMRNGNVVKGLTTAASVWVVAGIGLCIGAGFLEAAFFCTFLVLVCLYVLNKWEKVWLRKNKYQVINIKIKDSPGALGKIATKFGEYGIQIVNVKMEVETKEAEGPKNMDAEFQLKASNIEVLMKAMQEIAAIDIVIMMETDGKHIAANHSKGISI